jgi:hypothetical protein
VKIPGSVCDVESSGTFFCLCRTGEIGVAPTGADGTFTEINAAVASTDHTSSFNTSESPMGVTALPSLLECSSYV